MAIINTLVDGAAANAIFTANTGTEYAITTMIFCNTDPTVDAQLNVWLVPFGNVPGTSTGQILKNLSLPAMETFVMDSEKLILASQDAIWAQVDVPASNNVNATVSYVQIS